MKGIANPKITPCLWFHMDADEAVAYYRRIFPNSRTLSTSYYNDAMPHMKGKVLLIEFEIEGQRLQALNGDVPFPFSEAVSLSIEVEDQAELDRVWVALIADGGKPVQCGWLKDKYGLSWQVVPKGMLELLSGPDQARASRVMAALMPMVKLDIATLMRAADGK